MIQLSGCAAWRSDQLRISSKLGVPEQRRGALSLGLNAMPNSGKPPDTDPNGIPGPNRVSDARRFTPS